MTLVERLRTHYKVRCRICLHHSSDMALVEAVMAEAADRIEQLEEQASYLHENTWLLVDPHQVTTSGQIKEQP